MVPYTLDANDAKFGAGAFVTGGDIFDYLKESFDMLRIEGNAAPKMLSVGLHARIAGRPARAHGLRKFLEYVKGFDDVWVCRRTDIARHWITAHPPHP